MTSAARLRYGLRPRFATFTAMRPPGSSLRAHSANTSVSSWRYSTYELGTPSRSSSSSYCLPAKYGGDVTTSATEPSTIASMCRASPLHERLVDLVRLDDRVVAGERRRLEALVERGRVVALAPAGAEVGRGRRPTPRAAARARFVGARGAPRGKRTRLAATPWRIPRATLAPSARTVAERTI